MSVTRVEQVSWPEYGERIAALRRVVFIDEQGVPESEEWDGKDDGAVHFVLSDASGTTLGTARVLLETQTDAPSGVACHIGRVAVRKDCRNRGLGSELMRVIMEWCQQHQPDALVYLHAQTSRLTFYQRLGFEARGPEFMDAGIPHREMILPRETP